MFDAFTVTATFVVYVGALFLVARWVQKRAARGMNQAGNSWVYTLSLAAYCTSWSFYGSVGEAASTGLLVTAFYVGPSLGMLLWYGVLRKMVRIKNAHRVNSIADFVSARYGKSQSVAALVTLIAVVGSVPYVAIQLRSVVDSLAIMTASGNAVASSPSVWVARIVGALMVVFTIMFGVRRLDATERHPGMTMAIAIQSVVKLAAFVAVAVFAIFFVFDGYGDVMSRLVSSPHAGVAGFGSEGAASYATWTTYLLLSMSAIVLLPRQFHLFVVENTREEHLGTAMWLLPVYLLLMSVFMVPLAGSGLLSGYSLAQMDGVVLRLPLDQGSSSLAMLVFIGGFSAAISMIMTCTMTLSIMLTNHVVVPLVNMAHSLRFLRRHLLQCKWAAVVIVVFSAHWFEQFVGRGYTLVNLGLTAFTAALQPVPALLGGLVWRRGNRTGALVGMGAGFAMWIYTAMVPKMAEMGLLSRALLDAGPGGISWLQPLQFLGLSGLDSVTHSVFWSMLFNVGGYVVGSMASAQREEEQRLVEEFVGSAEPRWATKGKRKEPVIDLDAKVCAIRALLSDYFGETQIDAMLAGWLSELGIADQNETCITSLIGLCTEVEKCLAGSIGVAAAHKTMARAGILTRREKDHLMDLYREVLVDLPVTPAELKRKLDYFKERESLLEAHAQQLQALNRSLEEQIQRQQQAEVALAESEANYRSIFEHAVEGVFQSTPDGRFISVNPSLASMLGFDSPEDLINKISDIGREHYVKPALRDQMVETVERTGSVADFECELYRKDRSRVWISTHARAISDGVGNLKLIEGFAQDITQRKRAEEAEQRAYKDLERRVRDRTAELQQTNAELKTTMEAAEAATRAKSEFLANVSHEIRTPMNGVITAAELALNEEVSPRVSRLLNLIHSSGYSLLQIINDILDVSKIEAGRLSLDRRPFLLDDVIEGAIDLLAGRAGQGGVEMVLDFDMKTPKALVGDPIRLQQVLKNLLDNAIKFSERGGVVAVRVQVSEARRDAVELRFSVGDQGIGIAPEHLDRLFRPFSQVDASNTRKYGGTGLGLSICKKLVEMMGGHIGVQSRAGSGSVFSFTARFGSTKSDESRTAGLPEAVAGEVALLVDRPGQARDALSRAVRGCGLEVVAVSSGQQAIERLAEQNGGAAPGDEPVGLVLLDWRLNELSGQSLMTRLRELDVGVPIVAMLAAGASPKDDPDADRVHLSMSKPLYPRALVAMLGDVFGDEATVATKRPRQRTSWLKHRLKGLRVLVAEDNPTNQEITVALLERAGMVAQVAADGEQALRMAREGLWDLVLMDIQMPRVDGLEATRLMRGDPELEHMPIVAVTAYAMKGDQDKCLEAGMDAYLSKPINQARLFRVMWKALKSRGRVSSHEVMVVEPEAQRTGPFRVERRDLIEDLKGLSDALDQDDPEAVYRHLSAVSKRLKRTITSELEALVDDHDYEHAADTVSRLMGELTP